MTLQSIHFRNFKALRSLQLDLGELTVLTGPNNAEIDRSQCHSTLDAALRYARRRSPLDGHPIGTTTGLSDSH